MRGRQTLVWLGERSRARLERLAAARGDSMATVIRVAIDELWRAEVANLDIEDDENVTPEEGVVTL
jgi:hypothetical protein